VDSSGQLGVLASSERYKTAISAMGANTDKLSQLRPVTFHLKSDPHGEVQYGLIAEEVDKVYPELVIRNESGRIEGVRYDELAPMLLNEVQKQQAQLREAMQLKDQVRQQQRQLAELLRRNAEMQAANQAMQAAIVKLQARDQRLARR